MILMIIKTLWSSPPTRNSMSGYWDMGYRWMLMKCDFCGKEFESSNERRKYCCENCTNQAGIKNRKERKAQGRIRKCPCGKTFIPARNDAKFCSNKCKQADYRKRLENSTIYTIGYEKKDISEFIGILKINKIKYLVDVRNHTGSRYKLDFSEKRLKAALSNEGISYTSFKFLGVPKSIRDPYKTGEISNLEFNKYYRDYISNIDKVKYVREIKDSSKTVLMCYEKFAVAQEEQKINCHRSILANILKETGEFDEIIHL
jgi:endogenous inhibitor of DNA gyrase (YacG/DUF329 family)